MIAATAAMRRERPARTDRRAHVARRCLGLLLIVGMLTGGGPLLLHQLPPPRSQPGIANSCPAVRTIRIGPISVPRGPIAGYCQAQLVNAAHIINAADALGIGSHTQAIAVMTAMGESGLVNLDHGDVAGPDSRGLFQQRSNGAWGSLHDRMTPYVAAYHFFLALVAIPGWKTLTPTQAAHAVQNNADPDYYGRFWNDAMTVVAALHR